MLELSPCSPETTSEQNALVLPPHSDRPLPTAKGYPERAHVPAPLRGWHREMPGYSPPFYEAPSVRKNDRTVVPGGWADPADVSKEDLLLWSRSGYMKSFEGPIQHDAESGRPLNPLGRTGIQGRGLLGKWGPNHAADAILTRVSEESGCLEVLLIQRQCGAWAIPGGMVDSGEEPLEAARRELAEESGVALDGTAPVVVYQGIGDGPRNTDNAWIETSAYHFHLPPESALKDSSPRGASDALDARWMTVTPDLIRTMYANHGELLSIALTQFRLNRPDMPASVAAQLSEVPHVPLLTNLAPLKGRIGILGGTFDPVHNGHLEIGMRALTKHNLDAVVYIPTGHNPLKVNEPAATPRERVDMLQYALVGHPRMFVSPLEARVPGVAYTVNTLEHIREELAPDECELFLIVGADNLKTLSRWKDYQKLPALAEIVPVARPGSSAVSDEPGLAEKLRSELGPDVADRVLKNLVPNDGAPVSSTEIRAQLGKGERNPPMPASAYRYCFERGIYS